MGRWGRRPGQVERYKPREKWELGARRQSRARSSRRLGNYWQLEKSYCDRILIYLLTFCLFYWMEVWKWSGSMRGVYHARIEEKRLLIVKNDKCERVKEIMWYSATTTSIVPRHFRYRKVGAKNCLRGGLVKHCRVLSIIFIFFDFAQEKFSPQIKVWEIDRNYGDNPPPLKVIN